VTITIVPNEEHNELSPEKQQISRTLVMRSYISAD